MEKELKNKLQRVKTTVWHKQDLDILHVRRTLAFLSSTSYEYDSDEIFIMRMRKKWEESTVYNLTSLIRQRQHVKYLYYTTPSDDKIDKYVLSHKHNANVRDGLMWLSVAQWKCDRKRPILRYLIEYTIWLCVLINIASSSSNVSLQYKV